MTDLPRVSVVVPCYRRGEMLGGTVRSILDQSAPPGSYEIILVDNDSGDGTFDVAAELAAQNPERVRALREPRRGAGHARNRGAAEARAPLLLFLDDDMRAHRDLVREHLAAHELHEGSVLGYIETEWSDRPDLFLRFLHESEIQNTFPFADGDVVSYHFFYTGNVSVRRDPFLAIGGFDHAFHRYGVEDIDLGYRLQMEGEPLLFAKSALAAHRYDPTYSEFVRKRDAVGYSLAYFLDKYPHLRIHSGFEPRAFARLFPRFIVYTVMKPFILARKTAAMQGTANAPALSRWQWRYFGSTIRWRMYWSYRRAWIRLRRQRLSSMARYLG